MSRHFLPSRRARVLVCLLLLTGLFNGCGGDDGKDAIPLSISTLSSRADQVSDSAALVAVTVTPNVTAQELRWRSNGQALSAQVVSSTATSAQVLVQGLALGSNVVEAYGPDGRATGSVTLVNYPRSGPVFSGKQLTPFECRTVDAGLGEALDANCSVATRYDWFYFTAAGDRKSLADPLGSRPSDIANVTTSTGVTAPFIVRVESGTINRSIYRIAVLDNPSKADTWNGAAWNQRVIYRVGESTGAQYNQGSNNFAEVFKDLRATQSLARGFAYVISSLNVNKTNPNDVLAAETLMMVKQHLAKRYGLPRWTAGWGGSGGAIQQLLVADNYPGLLDGVMADAAFPDVWGTAQSVTDCRLLNRYFISHPGASAAQRQAFEGFTRNTCAAWDAGNGDVIVATGGAGNAGCGLNDKTRVYDPSTNPTGARCTIQDVSANILGRDAATGFARRPLDNVGVQYGLAALRTGSITMAQFLDVNEGVGGYDADGNLMAQRTVADATTLRRAYETGRFLSGGGGLATTAILHLRAYAEPGADIHTIYNDLLIREKLKRANGRSDNQVIWVLPNPALAPLLGLGTAQQAVLTKLVDEVVLQELDMMTQWLDGLTGDPAALTAAKVALYKPADAVDSCWGVADAKRYREEATYSGAGVCNAQYKKTPSPRMAAGGPLVDDLMKCQLKPVNPTDYAPAVPAAADLTRLAALFPQGVCDYSKSGVEQVPLKGTWLSY
jgi:hypothetical protein